MAEEFIPTGLGRADFRRKSEAENRLKLRSRRFFEAFCGTCHSWDWRAGKPLSDDAYFKAVVFDHADETNDVRSMQVNGENHVYRCKNNNKHSLTFSWNLKELERMKAAGKYPKTQAELEDEEANADAKS